MNIMNKNLINKIIKLNGTSCPETELNNPLLDRNVARALSKSFIKILSTSQQNANVNLKLKKFILENIRKLCQYLPEGHAAFDDNKVEILLQCYIENSKLKAEQNEDEQSNQTLDNFLSKKLQNMNIYSSYEPNHNPEIVQALLNLHEGILQHEELAIDSICCNFHDKPGMAGWLNNIWMNKTMLSSKVIDDICVKLAPLIEQQLLTIATELISNDYLLWKDKETLNKLFLDDSLQNLIQTCTISSNCFQMCCKILNYVFIISNFNTKLEAFIGMFIENVKFFCNGSIAKLYHRPLQSLVLLLDIDLKAIPESVQNVFVRPALDSLKELHKTSEHDLIMLLSHYTNWFDLFVCTL